MFLCSSRRVSGIMGSNKTDPRALLAQYSERADTAVRAALEAMGDLPLYGMLRYFMGYADEGMRPRPGTSGKRIRPALLLLTADLFGSQRHAADLAVAVELFHNFTLIHDDIEDGDELRRGRPTVWKLWGVNQGLNAGDAQAMLTTEYLLRAAADDTNSARAAYELSKRFQEVVEGQYLDLSLTDKPLDDPSVTVDAYLAMIEKKSAALVGAAVAAGGVAAGCDDGVRDTLFAYGSALGMAYQIADDHASIWGAETATGKRAHGDLVERKKTFPVLYARDHGARSALVAVYTNDAPLGSDQLWQLVSTLETVGAREATTALTMTYVRRAKDASARLPLDDTSKQTLGNIADLLVPLEPQGSVAGR